MKDEQKRIIKRRSVVGAIFLFLLLLAIFVPLNVGARMKGFRCNQNRGRYGNDDRDLSYGDYSYKDCNGLNIFNDLAVAWVVGLLITGAVCLGIFLLCLVVSGLYTGAKKIYNFIEKHQTKRE